MSAALDKLNLHPCKCGEDHDLYAVQNFGETSETVYCGTCHAEATLSIWQAGLMIKGTVRKPASHPYDNYKGEKR